MEVSGQHHTPAELPPGGEGALLNQLQSRMCVPQSLFDRFEEEKNCLARAMIRALDLP